MLQVDFLLMVIGIRGRRLYYLSLATYFGVKRLTIAISEDIVMRKRPFIH